METLTIKTIGPWMLHGEQILLTGSCPALGAWNPDKALPMTVTQGILWSIELDKALLPSHFEYKFLCRKADGSIVWETCFNRTNPYAVTERRPSPTSIPAMRERPSPCSRSGAVAAPASAISPTSS